MVVDDCFFKISHMEFDEKRYEELLMKKIDTVKSLLSKEKKEDDGTSSSSSSSSCFKSICLAEGLLDSRIEIFRSLSKHYRQKCRFPSRSVRQRGVLTGVSQMRRRRACAFLPEPLPFSHTRSMAACIENGAARVGRFSRDSMGLG